MLKTIFYLRTTLGAMGLLVCAGVLAQTALPAINLTIGAPRSTGITAAGAPGANAAAAANSANSTAPNNTLPGFKGYRPL